MFTSSTEPCSFPVHSGSLTFLWHPYFLSSFHADSTIVGVNQNTSLQSSIWAMWTKPFVTFHEILVGKQVSLERLITSYYNPYRHGQYHFSIYSRKQPGFWSLLVWGEYRCIKILPPSPKSHLVHEKFERREWYYLIIEVTWPAKHHVIVGINGSGIPLLPLVKLSQGGGPYIPVIK